MPPPTSRRPGPTSPDLLQLSPVPQLLARVKAELAASFVPGRPIRVSRAPGRLDVMGGIIEYTGGLLCQGTIDRAAAVAVQARDDRQVQVFSFNQFDAHTPFTAVIPLDALTLPIDQLRQEFAQPGRQWSGQLAGCLAILHDEKLIDLKNPELKGVNIALFSDIPAGVGLASSAAIEVAAMTNLLEHYVGLGPWGLGLGEDEAIDSSAQGPRPKAQGLDVMRVAALCQRVASELVGRPGSLATHAAIFAGAPGGLTRIKCQPHELADQLLLPAGVRVVGINSSIKPRMASGQHAKTRCAAFMGHKIILETIRKMGATAGRQMIADPLNGYLANLPLDDYKKYFRSQIPETIKGGSFLLQYGSLTDKSTPIEPDTIYHVQSATDHHVFDAHRVREFARYLDEAQLLLSEKAHPKPGVGVQEQSPALKLLLDKAGHLMYASHLSYTRDAKLGADECDLLVDLARQRESAGIYGAKITGIGAGGTVAVLCNEGDRTDAAIAEILQRYESQTNVKPEAFLTSTPGAWAAGTVEV